MTIINELGSLPERIKAAAERVRELTEAVTAERKLRDELIVTAIDEARIPQAAVARAAGLSQPHVVRILAAHGDDD